MTKVAASVGDELVVLPGGVKRLPRTIFKSAVKYNCDLSLVTDQIRCTVRCIHVIWHAAYMYVVSASIYKDIRCGLTLSNKTHASCLDAKRGFRLTGGGAIAVRS